jgi:hypothetical protein
MHTIFILYTCLTFAKSKLIHFINVINFDTRTFGKGHSLLEYLDEKLTGGQASTS